ncbi:MAG: tetratricopeptide repeat protein [Bacteroidia bacterium]|nr:tetratricopeptide repeat protein [Bacteroidia bacterium]
MISRTYLITGAFELFRMGRYDLCKEKAMEILKDFPDDDMAYYILAVAEMEQGNLKRARKHIYKAISLDPEYPDHYNVAAMISTKNWEFHKAIEEAEQALRLRNTDSTFWEVKGWAYFNLNLLDKTWECCQQGLMHDPEHAGCLRQRAMVLEEREKYEEAAASAREYLGQDPENEKAHFILARNLWQSGKPGEAIKHFAEALRLKPDNYQALQGLRKSVVGARWRFMYHYLRLLDRKIGLALTILIGFLVFILTLGPAFAIKGLPFILKLPIAGGIGFAAFAFLNKGPWVLAEFFVRDDKYLSKVIFRDGILGRMMSWAFFSMGVFFSLLHLTGIYASLLWIGYSMIGFSPLPSSIMDDMSEARDGGRIFMWMMATILLASALLSFYPWALFVCILAGVCASFFAWGHRH